MKVWKNYLINAFALKDEIGRSDTFWIGQDVDLVTMLNSFAGSIQEIVIIFFRFTTSCIDGTKNIWRFKIFCVILQQNIIYT